MAEILFPSGPHGHKTCREINEELAELKAELEQARQERDIARAQGVRIHPGPAW